MFFPMDPIIFIVLLTSLFIQSFALSARSTHPTSKITVVGVVYCDTCASNSLSKHGYFMAGVDVHIRCKFRTNTPKTTDQMNFSVNRTTDKHGVYRLNIPSVDGINCFNGMAIVSMCEASLIKTTSSYCNVPVIKTTVEEISVKSEQDNLCIYSLNAMSYKPSKKNTTLCGNLKEELATSLNSSKCFLPYFPPFKFPWPPLPNLPFQLPPLSSLPFPPLPPLPYLPFPPFPFQSPPSLPFPPIPFQSPPSFPFPPFPFQSPPSLPFPFPPLPPFPPTSSVFPSPPPPSFNLGDPRTWIPNIPSFSPPPPPPAFNLGDPRTWIPNIPSFSPPPPPAFSLTDPRTWIPHNPQSSPSKLQNQNP